MRLTLALCAILAVAFLVVDLLVPLGIAVGICYILVVVLAGWTRVPWIPAAFAAVGTLFIGIGWLASPSGVPSQLVSPSVNRILTLLVLWVIAVTVTFRRRAERKTQRELRESEERFRRFFENCAIPLWEEDWSAVKARLAEFKSSGVDDLRTYLSRNPETIRSCMSRVKLLDTNRASLDLFQAPDKNAILQNLDRLLAPESLDEIVDQLSDIADGESHLRGEQVVITFNGERRYVVFDFAALPGCETSLERVLVSLVDTTETRRAVEALREADRRKDEFLATLGHELRNPLAAIRNGVELMKLRKIEDANLVLARDIIDRQTKSLTRLIDDLLEISRITRGKIELRNEPVQLGTVITDAAEESRSIIDRSGHHLSVDVPSRGPWIDGDSTRLTQVFTNLLNNAAKYTPNGGRISLSVTTEDHRAVASVRDNGIGIPLDRLGGVFDMFSQGTPALGHSHDGLGIGLALVKGIVELHGGTVEARSAGDGRGSEFVVCLPLTDEPERADLVTGDGDPSLANVVGSKILVVEDNADVARSLAMMLRADGHEIRTAHDGQEAVEAARTFRPRFVLLDIGLPKANGYEVARRIRSEDWGKRMILIAQTGWGKEDDKRRAKEAGFDHHLTKPLQRDALMKLLDGR